MQESDKIQVYDNQPIRTAWDEQNEEWYFSIVDVVSVLTDQPDRRRAGKYWSVLKTRLKKEGSQLPTNCSQLKLKADDGKGDKERRVYFDAKAKVHLQEYIERRQDNNQALFVTLDAPHDRLKISGVEIRLRQLGRRLDLERIHPHKFRRTMATRAIDKGMPIEQVQKILGHSQIDTTMQYAMVNQNNVKSSHQKYMS